MNDLFDRFDLNHGMAEFAELKNPIYTVELCASKAFCRSIKIIPPFTSIKAF